MFKIGDIVENIITRYQPVRGDAMLVPGAAGPLWLHQVPPGSAPRRLCTGSPDLSPRREVQQQETWGESILLDSRV